MTLKTIFALIVLTASPALAQDETTGRDTYLRYCATCHGLEARGDGPMGPSLILLPKDLTQLQTENGDVFPTFSVVTKIDGSDPLTSHGSPMPVYGDFFEGKAIALKVESGQMVMTSQPIVDLVRYLESVQE